MNHLTPCAKQTTLNSRDHTKISHALTPPAKPGPRSLIAIANANRARYDEHTYDVQTENVLLLSSIPSLDSTTPTTE